MIHPQITNKLNGQLLSLFLKPLEFFYCQHSSPTALDDSSSRSISYIILTSFFHLSFWSLMGLDCVNTSSSCFMSPRIRDRLLDSFFRILISLFLSFWYHLLFWILILFCHNTSSKYMKSLWFLGCQKPSRWPMVSSLKPPWPFGLTAIVWFQFSPNLSHILGTYSSHVTMFSHLLKSVTQVPHHKIHSFSHFRHGLHLEFKFYIGRGSFWSDMIVPAKLVSGKKNPHIARVSLKHS